MQAVNVLTAAAIISVDGEAGGLKNSEIEGGREREICKLHKFVVKKQRPRSHRVKYNMMRAEECLGRSRWIARPQTAHLRGFSVRSPPLPSLPPVRCLLSVDRGRKRSLVGRCGRLVPPPPVRRPFRDLGTRPTGERRFSGHHKQG